MTINSKILSLYNWKFSRQGINNLGNRIYRNQQQALELLAVRKSDRILEIGCNQGDFVKILKKSVVYVRGCDINQAAISASQLSALEVMSVENLQYTAGQFNKIVSLHTLEHIVNLPRVFQEISRVLSPGGQVVLIYPWEIFRGSNNFFSAWKLYGNPFFARQLHVHKLSPSKLKKITNLTLVKSGFFLGPWPTYYTLLEKTS